MSELTLRARLEAIAGIDQGLHLACRRITPQDLVKVADLFSRVYPAGDDGQETPAIEQAREQIELFWNGEYGPIIKEATLGAWKEHRLLGAIIVLEAPPWEDEPATDPPTPCVAEFFVHPKHRGLGIATSLLGAAAHECAELGLDSMTMRIDISKAQDAFILAEYLGFETENN
ncbi:MAG: GNAT family N-acetyltransferase [Actinomycetaceae bacterium]|nr:GNAT family N-acetyltransferase [Actinomycetaceae bacterium]